MVKKMVLVFKSPPYGSGRVAEGLRMATAMIAMDVLPQILFVDDGVYCLLTKQEPEDANLTSIKERLKTLSDLVGLHAFSDSLAQRKLGQEDFGPDLSVKIQSLEETARMVSQGKAVLSF